MRDAELYPCELPAAPWRDPVRRLMTMARWWGLLSAVPGMLTLVLLLVCCALPAVAILSALLIVQGATYFAIRACLASMKLHDVAKAVSGGVPRCFPGAAAQTDNVWASHGWRCER